MNSGTRVKFLRKKIKTIGRNKYFETNAASLPEIKKDLNLYGEMAKTEQRKLTSWLWISLQQYFRPLDSRTRARHLRKERDNNSA